MAYSDDFQLLKAVRADILRLKNLFRNEILDKSGGFVYYARKKDGDTYGIDSLSATIWLSIVFEIENALNDLSQESLERLSFCQRRTFFSVRFAMEATADLLFLEEHPSELEKIVTEKDFHKKLHDLNGIENLAERDKKVSYALRHENEFSVQTSKRIEEYFMGNGLTKYAILCLFTHNNDLGNELFSRKSEKEYLELYYQATSVLIMIIEKLAQYMLRHDSFGASSERLKELTKDLRHLVILLYNYLSPDL
ncbi:hypothetical protein IJG78_03240 [Candidatus Saccharibacteria bacterium]|nr:hypothetical protein [Candidatus Saccharibacteria bacterium]